MAVSVNSISMGNALEISISGKLHVEDYDQFVPKLEEMIQENGKVSILFEMHDFDGWETAALWEDLKFDVKHFGDFERIAMVGEKPWEKGMSVFCKPFTAGKVKYFDQGQKSDAVAWVNGN